jgi:hypothetical protein
MELCQVYENRFTIFGFVSTGFTECECMKTVFTKSGFVSTGFTDSGYMKLVYQIRLCVNRVY